MTERTANDIIQDWIQIVRGEYLEIPGLLLTRTQIQQLWGLDTALCDRIIEAMVEKRLLRRTASGAFVMPDEQRH